MSWEWCQHQGSESHPFYLSPLVHNLSDSHNTEKKENRTCASAQLTRIPETFIHLCTKKVGGLEPRGVCRARQRQQQQEWPWASTTSLAKVVEGEGDELGWWIHLTESTTAGETTATVSRERRRRQKELKRQVSCCLLWDSCKKTAHGPLGMSSPTQGSCSL